jgi:hypothetical protein
VQALDEFVVVRGILSQVVQESGNAQAAMSLPQLTTPRSVSELRLLQVLRLMTVLRTPKQTNASALAAAAASVGAVTDLTGSVLGGGAQASSTTGKTTLPLHSSSREKYFTCETTNDHHRIFLLTSHFDYFTCFQQILFPCVMKSR